MVLEDHEGRVLLMRNELLQQEEHSRGGREHGAQAQTAAVQLFTDTRTSVQVAMMKPKEPAGDTSR